MSQGKAVKGVRVTVVRETDPQAREQFSLGELRRERFAKFSPLTQSKTGIDGIDGPVVNKRGVITGLVLPHGHTGDTAEDPLFWVRLSDGRFGAFWGEELRPRLRDLRGLRVRMVEGHGDRFSRGQVVQVVHARRDGKIMVQTVGRTPAVLSCCSASRWIPAIRGRRRTRTVVICGGRTAESCLTSFGNVSAAKRCGTARRRSRSLTLRSVNAAGTWRCRTSTPVWNFGQQREAPIRARRRSEMSVTVKVVDSETRATVLELRKAFYRWEALGAPGGILVACTPADDGQPLEVLERLVQHTNAAGAAAMRAVLDLAERRRAETELENAVYRLLSLELGALEYSGVLRSSGHHKAQDIGPKVVAEILERLTVVRR